jgi:hypothetical protein
MIYSKTGADDRGGFEVERGRQEKFSACMYAFVMLIVSRASATPSGKLLRIAASPSSKFIPGWEEGLVVAAVHWIFRI